MLPIIFSSAGAVAVAAVGGILTRPRGTWYRNLRKPGWKPPDWLFGPAWTLILAMAAASCVLAWQSSGGTSGTRLWVAAQFGLNAALNILWNILFFGLRRPDWAMFEVVVLWLSIAGLMVSTAALSSTASLLLAPYIVWVSFASFLNLAMVRLNAPFMTYSFTQARSDDAGRL